MGNLNDRSGREGNQAAASSLKGFVDGRTLKLLIILLSPLSVTFVNIKIDSTLKRDESLDASTGGCSLLRAANNIWGKKCQSFQNSGRPRVGAQVNWLFHWDSSSPQAACLRSPTMGSSRNSHLS